MIQCNTLNVTLSKSKPNKLKLGIRNGTQVILIFHQIWLVTLMIRLISLYKLLLTNTQG